MTLIQPMDASASVRMVGAGWTVPFHQLAAVRNIAMGMLLWTWTAQTVVCATVQRDGLVTVAMSLHHVKPNMIALVMEQQPTLMQLMDAFAAVLMNSQGTIVPSHLLATVCAIATDTPLGIKTARMVVCANVPIHGLVTVAT